MSIAKQLRKALALTSKHEIPRHEKWRLDLYDEAEMNEHGYRSESFNVRREFNFLTIGDSWAEAGGVDFPNSFGQKLKVKIQQKTGLQACHWNLGIGGKGCDYIARMLAVAVPQLKPDFVMVLFPADLVRREYFLETGEVFNLNFGAIHAVKHQTERLIERGIEPHHYDIIEAFYETQSNKEYAVRTIHSILLFSEVLNANGVNWLFSMTDFKVAAKILQELMEAGWINRNHYLGSAFERLDFYQFDEDHPGDESHEIFAQKIFDRLIDTGILKGE